MGSKSVRYPSVDVLRGLAILAMIEAHIWVLSGGFQSLVLAGFIMAAPTFLMVSGIGFGLFLRSRRDVNKKLLFVDSSSRALALLVITSIPFITMSILSNDIAFWSVFQVIVVGYFLGFFVRDSIIVQSLSIAFCLISPLVLASLGMGSFFTNGTFPLLPFLSYFLFGQLISGIYPEGRAREGNNRKMAIASLILIGGALIILLSLENITIESQRTPLVFFATASIVTATALMLMLTIDGREKIPIIIKPLEIVGRISLSSYYLHLAIIYSLSLLISLTNITILPTFLNPILVVIIILLLTAIEIVWRKYHYAFGPEWWLRVISKRILRYYQNRIKEFSKERLNADSLVEDNSN